jgi:translation initiation factor IF-3
LAIARDLDLDLVEVAAQANPPVCRIMDYGKYKYEAAQQAKESRRKSTNVSIKEMKYRPKIGVGDFTTKTRKVEKFLGEGHKVKITIMFRGREMQHPELGKRILDRVAEAVAHFGRVEVVPKLDGRNMIMVLAPDRKARAAWEATQKKDVEDAEDAGLGTNGTGLKPEGEGSLPPLEELDDSDDSDLDDDELDDEDDDAGVAELDQPA